MKTKTLLIGFVAALCVWSCSSKDDVIDIDKPYEPKPEEPVTRHSYTPVQLNETQQAINAKLQEFSWKLFKEVYANRNEGDNLMISPISLEVDLGMFINGLEGETLKEVLKTMGLENYTKEQINDFFQTMMKGIEKADEIVTFKSANSFWYTKNGEVNKDFASLLKNSYDAKTEAVDFSDPKTKDVINSWCAENTENRITKMIEETDPLDLFHLMNAVYFRARWEEEFSPSMTKKEPFYYADGKTEDVDMMFQNKIAYYGESDAFQFTYLPFIDYSFSMLLFLPKEGVDLADAIPATFNFDSYKSLNGGNIDVSLWMPKFTTEYKENKLFPYMQDINPNLKFYVEDIKLFDDLEVPVLGAKQKTFIKIDEEGAEAAAITDIEGDGDFLVQEHVDFRLDRPFFYAIVESNTQCPLFIGYYGN